MRPLSLNTRSSNEHLQQVSVHAHRIVVLGLLVLNAVVLLGQLWPAGAPPFSRAVNILFLAASFVYYAIALVRPSPRRRTAA